MVEAYYAKEQNMKQIYVLTLNAGLPSPKTFVGLTEDVVKKKVNAYLTRLEEEFLLDKKEKVEFRKDPLKWFERNESSATYPTGWFDIETELEPVAEKEEELALHPMGISFPIPPAQRGQDLKQLLGKPIRDEHGNVIGNIVSFSRDYFYTDAIMPSSAATQSSISMGSKNKKEQE